MRKFLLTFIFLLTFLVSFSQSMFTFNSSNYNRFSVSGEGMCGVGNAYCLVNRSPGPNQYGNYTYSIYFATNSYLANCNPSKTYIPNIEIIYYDDASGKYLYPVNFYTFWVSVGQTSLVYTLYHPNPYLTIKVRTGKMEPTTY
jgi:hypothetical protein